MFTEICRWQKKKLWKMGSILLWASTYWQFDHLGKMWKLHILHLYWKLQIEILGVLKIVWQACFYAKHYYFLNQIPYKIFQYMLCWLIYYILNGFWIHCTSHFISRHGILHKFASVARGRFVSNCGRISGILRVCYKPYVSFSS